jgi:hypothetical protein
MAGRNPARQRYTLKVGSAASRPCLLRAAIKDRPAAHSRNLWRWRHCPRNDHSTVCSNLESCGSSYIRPYNYRRGHNHFGDAKGIRYHACARRQIHDHRFSGSGISEPTREVGTHGVIHAHRSRREGRWWKTFGTSHCVRHDRSWQGAGRRKPKSRLRRRGINDGVRRSAADDRSVECATGRS